MIENWQRAGFGLYFHWPFCQAKCPYCDFNSHVWRTVDHDAWVDGFLREVERAAEGTSERVVSTVFFGGGTPSLMPVESVARILGAVRSNWDCANDIEITLEANPTSVEAQKFAGYRDAGVNRVSIGVQSLRAADLERLGRLHTVDEAIEAIRLGRSVFDRLSFDIIYARQDQTLDDWRSELKQCLELGPDHMSLYQLTIEDGTAFGALHRAGKLRGIPSDDVSADMYDATQDMMFEAGLPQYEISNHARPGHEARHNKIYWNGGDWVGIGPGAHGRLTLNGARVATETPNDPRRWLAQAMTADGAITRNVQTGTDAALEYLMMSLRTADGCSLDHLNSLDDGLVETITTRSDMGDLPLELVDQTLRVKPDGRILLNAVLSQLVRDSA